MTLTAAERGSLGGKTTHQRHGRVHMEAIGRAGFQATVERYYGGDVGAYMNALRSHQAKGEYDSRSRCQVRRPSAN